MYVACQVLKNWLYNTILPFDKVSQQNNKKAPAGGSRPGREEQPCDFGFVRRADVGNILNGHLTDERKVVNGEMQFYEAHLNGNATDVGGIYLGTPTNDDAVQALDLQVVRVQIWRKADSDQ